MQDTCLLRIILEITEHWNYRAFRDYYSNLCVTCQKYKPIKLEEVNMTEAENRSCGTGNEILNPGHYTFQHWRLLPKLLQTSMSLLACDFIVLKCLKMLTEEDEQETTPDSLQELGMQHLLETAAYVLLLDSKCVCSTTWKGESNLLWGPGDCTMPPFHTEEQENLRWETKNNNSLSSDICISKDWMMTF